MSRAVSPELVLVDPVLARAERAHLAEPVRFEPPMQARDVDAVPLQRRRGRELLIPAVAAVSLAVNCALAIVALGGKVDRSPQRLTAAPRPAGAVRASPPPIPANASPVERHVLQWVYRMPAAALPTPLARAARDHGPVVRVRCRKRPGPASYGCIVRVGGKRLQEGLAVQYPAAAEGGARIEWVG